MPIEVTCKKCRKAYRVPDKYAGKKFKCKKCEAAIEVFDELDGIEEDEFGQNEDFGDHEEPTLPRPKKGSRPKKSSPKKRCKSKVGNGIPIAAICVLSLKSIFLLSNVVWLIVALTTGGSIMGPIFWVTFSSSILIGLFKRSQKSRKAEFFVCGFALLVCGLFLLIVMLSGTAEMEKAMQRNPQFQGGDVGGLVFIAFCFFLFHAVMLGCLLAPGSRDYFSEE